MYIKPEMEFIKFLQDIITTSVPDFDVDYSDIPGDENPDNFSS